MPGELQKDAEPKPVSDREFKAIFALIATAAVCAVLVLSTPRALIPTELPPLRLDSERVAQALAADAALASEAPGGSDVDELEARYLAEGLAERGGVQEMGDVHARQDGNRKLAAQVFARVGPQGVKALRASAVERCMRALRGADEDDTAGVLGTLPEMLRTYGLYDAEGRMLSPELSVRAMAKARWNMVHGLPTKAGLTTIEVQAFEGFIALHAGAAPSERRAEAARAFYAAGGHRSAQAYATWLYQGGSANEALSTMRRAHALRPELATRNFAIGIAAPPL
jgi:hypothetical protein